MKGVEETKKMEEDMPDMAAVPTRTRDCLISRRRISGVWTDRFAGNYQLSPHHSKKLKVLYQIHHSQQLPPHTCS